MSTPAASDKTVLFVHTSAKHFGGKETGVWLEESATPYYHFTQDKKFKVEFANILGGASPIDPASKNQPFFTKEAQRFIDDPIAYQLFCTQKKLDSVNPLEYDALFLVGGHGTVVDFTVNKTLKASIESCLAAGKIVAAVCHGPIALAQCEKPSGEPLLQGMRVTGFSNSEEEAVKYTSQMPFLLESKFKELGADYHKGDDWSSNVCVDGNLVTGQNPQSSKECASVVGELLS